jgi:ligand-binding sensor domain-containing protein
MEQMGYLTYLNFGAMKKLIVILILFSFTGLSGQQISFTEISEKKGLSSNYANTVYKDHMGFVWIGTQEGLNKYDGTDIKQYHSYPDKKFSISNDMIKTIAEDADSNLWIGTQYGLNLYDRSRDQFYRFFADSTDNSSLRDNEIKGFLLDKKQRFWIATNKGISGLEKKADGSFSFRNYLPIRKIKAHEGEWSIRFSPSG